MSVEDLVGLPWSEANCYGLARLAVDELLGYELPSSPAELLRERDAIAIEIPAGQALRAGDVVQFEGRFGPGRHVGVALDAFRLLTTSSQVGHSFITRISLVEPTGRFRLREDLRR